MVEKGNSRSDATTSDENQKLVSASTSMRLWMRGRGPSRGAEPETLDPMFSPKEVRGAILDAITKN